MFARQMAKPQRKLLVPVAIFLVVALFSLVFFPSSPVEVAGPGQLTWGKASKDLASDDGPGQANTRQPRSSQEEHSQDESVPTTSCGDDPVVYPSWPPGFMPNVSAVFIVGAHLHRQDSATHPLPTRAHN